jgi:phosphohistidine phosphatase
MNCSLYLIRHGIAEERGPAYPIDDERPLTEEGIRRLEQSVKGLHALDVTLDRVLTSPLVRARQTAEIVAAGLACREPLLVVDALRPGARFEALMAALERLGRERAIALVGHEPSMGEFGARLIGAARPLLFKKGTVCRIDADTIPPVGAGTLQWLLPPRALRAFAKAL